MNWEKYVLIAIGAAIFLFYSLIFILLIFGIAWLLKFL